MLRLIHNRSIVKYFLAALGYCVRLLLRLELLPLWRMGRQALPAGCTRRTNRAWSCVCGHPGRLRLDRRLLQRVHQRRHHRLFPGHR